MVLHQLAVGVLVVPAEVRPADGRVRISSPAGWIDADLLEPAAPAERRKVSFEEFKQHHATVAPGDRHGLEFPISLEMLQAYGPEFLTKAFRAAETISPDNAVTAIVAVQRLHVPGASENALITVSYARQEPGLSGELFVKFPPKDVEFKYSLARMAHGEVKMLQFAREQTLPVRVPRLYYGDYCSYTQNYMFITERLRFGEDGVEPAHRKGFDHQVPDIEEHYVTLAKAMASLTAAHKTGALGHDLEVVFPYLEGARDYAFLDDPTPRVDRLIDFVGRVAPQLFVAEASDPAFLKRFRDDLLFGFKHKDVLRDYLREQVDYTGLCHPNLNVDNAWFWRDESGALRAGLFDWAGAGQMSMAEAMSGMLMMQIPEKHIAIVEQAIRAYLDEYHRLGGLRLDFELLHRQYQVSLYSTALYVIIAWVSDLFWEKMSEEDYRDITDRHDERLVGAGLYQGLVWIDCMLREWLQPVTPGEVCRRLVERRAGRLA